MRGEFSTHTPQCKSFYDQHRATIEGRGGGRVAFSSLSLLGDGSSNSALNRRMLEPSSVPSFSTSRQLRLKSCPTTSHRTVRGLVGTSEGEVPGPSTRGGERVQSRTEVEEMTSPTSDISQAACFSDTPGGIPSSWCILKEPFFLFASLLYASRTLLMLQGARWISLGHKTTK